MFLTTSNVLWPVTSVCFFAVEKTSDAELFGGGTVPASPVTGAGGFVSENSVEPLAMLS